MKKKTGSYNYGECEICNTPMQKKLIKQNFWIRGKLIVVEDVPAGVCPKCGEKVVQAGVGRWILKLIENSDRIAKAPRISVPKIKFDIKEARVLKVLSLFSIVSYQFNSFPFVKTSPMNSRY